jgi:hypothetical protein
MVFSALILLGDIHVDGPYANTSIATAINNAPR